VDGLAAYHAITADLLRTHDELAAHGGLLRSPLVDYPFPLRCDGAPFFKAPWTWWVDECDRAVLLLMAQEGWKAAQKHMGPFNPEMHAVCEYLMGKAKPAGDWTFRALWADWQTRRPELFCINHGDAHAGNMMFDASPSSSSSAPSRRPLIMYDMQVVLVRPVMTDIGYFAMHASSSDAECDRLELPLLQRYFDAMPCVRALDAKQHEGEVDTSSERAALWADFMLLYRTTLIYHTFMLVGLASTIIMRNHDATNAARVRAGRVPLTVQDNPICRGLVQFIGRLQTKAKKHNLHQLCAQWSGHADQ
jgi:hypothetical protein